MAILASFALAAVGPVAVINGDCYTCKERVPREDHFVALRAASDILAYLANDANALCTL